MGLSESMKQFLVSPCCKAELREADEALICTACKRGYPVEEGIPVLLLERAFSLQSSDPTNPERPR